MFWRGIIVGLALGLWVALVALWALRSDDDAAPVCPAATCCGGCGQGNHAHRPPANVAWAPPGPLRYYCGLSDHGGGFVWDQGGGYVWDQGGGYLWDNSTGTLADHGGGYVWDHGGGYVWDHGGGSVWDHGGGFIWDNDLSDRGPLPGGAVVPVPSEAELGEVRKSFEFRCRDGAGGANDIAVVRGNIAVSIVMPQGNVDFECAVSEDGGPEIIERVNPPIGDTSGDRAYCMVVKNTDDERIPHEFIDPPWAP